MKTETDEKRDAAMQEVIRTIQDASDTINDTGAMLLMLVKGWILSTYPDADDARQTVQHFSATLSEFVEEGLAERTQPKAEVVQIPDEALTMRPAHLAPEALAIAVVLAGPEQDLDPSVRAWLRQGFARYLADTEIGLEAALGLRVRHWARNRRDECIRRAAGALRGSTYDKARQLSRWAAYPAKFNQWPGRAGNELRLAMGYCDGRLPKSERQFLRIIGR